MNRFFPILTMLLVTLSLVGCKPPTQGVQTGGSIPNDGGRPIITVEKKSRPPFKTVEIDGAELLQARGEVGKFGGTFYDNSIGDGPKTFNAFASSDATSSTMAGLLGSGLVTVDSYTGEVIPYLAKTVTLSDDKLTYTVTLRKGLQWSDGKPITSKDVVFTWNQIIKPGLGNVSNRDVVMVDGKFPEVKALDELTIQFKTAKPFAPFMMNLSNTVYPEHILKSVVAKGDPTFSSFWGVADAEKHPEKLISSGMWLLEKYEPRERAVFKRNPKFFMVDQKGQRLPYLDRYVFTFVKDRNNEALQFEQGKTDSFSVPGNLVSLVRRWKTPTFKLYNLGPATGTIFVSFNLTTRKNAQGKPVVDPVKQKWFNDVNFRQAINHAINREDIVKNILKGVGAPLYTAEALSSVYLNQNLAKGFPADIELAKSLLKKSGFTWNAEGQLLDKDGHKVEFNLVTNSGNDEREAVGVSVQQDLQKLGMKVNFKPMEFNVLVDQFTNGTYEAMLMGLTGSNLEPNGGANVWRSDAFLHFFNKRPDGKATNLLPWEKEIDQLFEQGAQTFGIENRKKYYDRFQEIVFEQAPLIYLYSPLQIIAVRERIQNFDPTPLGAFHNLEEIWIDDSVEKK